MPNVAETAEFAASYATPPFAPLKRLLEFEHLSRTIRHILHAKLDAAERAASASEGRWRGWRRCVIDRIVDEAPEIRSFHLKAEDGEYLCQPKPGQFVTVRMSGGDGSLTRTWSLSSYAHNLEHYRLTVRRQQGPGSRRLHDLNVGAVLDLRAPSGNFVLDMGGFRPVVLIAAGIGITPLYAMLQAHLGRGQTGAPVHLIYGGKTPADIAFRTELNVLAAANPSLHMTYVYSSSGEGGRAAGRITPQLVIELLADNYVMLGDRRIPLPWFENDTYLCGPGAFCAEIKDGLVAGGANADHIFHEFFSRIATVNAHLESADVYFNRSNVRCNWHADVDLTLLELAEQAGITLKSECRAGACLTCKTAVLDGAVTADLGEGWALLCIGRPKTRRLILDC
jgi:ferredoxin-NADP reductase